MENKKCVHFLWMGRTYNLACGRKGVKEYTANSQQVTCKKCLGAIRIDKLNRPKVHFSPDRKGNEYRYFPSICHTPNSMKCTSIIENVTCQSCLYKITKQLGICQSS